MTMSFSQATFSALSATEMICYGQQKFCWELSDRSSKPEINQGVESNSHVWKNRSNWGFQSRILPELWWNTSLDEMVSSQYTQLASKLKTGLKTENLNNFTGVKQSRCTGAVWATRVKLSSRLALPLASKNYQKLLPFRHSGQNSCTDTSRVMPITGTGNCFQPWTSLKAKSAELAIFEIWKNVLLL